MNKTAVASELVKLAKELVAVKVGFPFMATSDDYHSFDVAKSVIRALGNSNVKVTEIDAEQCGGKIGMYYAVFSDGPSRIDDPETLSEMCKRAVRF